MTDDLTRAGMMPAWAGRIRAAWQKSTEAIFETGRLIIEAKAALPHGAFTRMIDDELPFGPRTAQRLMAIASDERLADPTHVSLLPPSWGTLYELTKLDDALLEQRFSDGTIRPDMERGDVVALATDDGEREPPMPRNSRAIAPTRTEPGDSLDYFPTPPWATRALVEDVLLAQLGIGLRHLEVEDPACGEGHITGVLEEYGAEVHGYDIFDYSQGGRSPPGWVAQRDYLAGGKSTHGAPHWVISNPPFEDKALAFVDRALDDALAGVAMFFRSQWAVEGLGRYEQLFRDRPPTVCAFFVERVNLCKGRWDPDGSTLTAYCWLVWVKGQVPHPTFWIPPGRRVERWHNGDVERFTARPVLALSAHALAAPTALGPDTRSAHALAAPTALGPDSVSRHEAVEAGGEAATPASSPETISAHALASPTALGPASSYYRRLVAADQHKGKHTWATAEPIIRAAYACDPVIPSKTLAADLGAPIGSVLGWAGRHGLTRPERRGGPDRIGQQKPEKSAEATAEEENAV